MNTITAILLQVYVILTLGFVLHTSRSREVLGKYSLYYFLFIIILIVLFFPFKNFLQFLSRSSKIKFKKKAYKVSVLNKIFFTVFVIFSLFIASEITIRAVGINFGSLTEESSQRYYSIDDFHPFLQHQNSVSDNVKNPQLHINKDGFRGEEVISSKEPGTFRIFILGGSTALNKDTPYESSAPKVLQEMLRDKYPQRKIEVLNGGAEAYTTEHSIIEYLFKIKDYSPDLIIMWHGVNDMIYSCLTDNTRQQYEEDYSHNFSALYNVINEHYKPKPLFNSITFSYLKHIFGSSFYSDIRSKFIKTEIFRDNPSHHEAAFNFRSINEYERNLKSFIDITKSDNVTVILGNQPYLYNRKLDKENYQWSIQRYCVSRGAYPDINSLINGLEKFNSVTERVANENGVTFVDLEAMLPKTPEYFSDDFHFFPAISNKIVAEELFKSIVSADLINSSSF